MNTYKKQGLSLLAHVTGCLSMRFIFNAFLMVPNIEPLYACSVLVGWKHTYVHTFLFSVLSITIFDFLTARIGSWTIVTGILYGLLGAATVKFSQHNKKISTENSRLLNLLGFTIIGTLMYDFLTGCVFGPLMFNQPFLEAVVGQIPFSVLHILGNLVLVTSVSFIGKKCTEYRLHITQSKSEKKIIYS